MKSVIVVFLMCGLLTVGLVTTASAVAVMDVKLVTTPDPVLTANTNFLVDVYVKLEQNDDVYGVAAFDISVESQEAASTVNTLQGKLSGSRYLVKGSGSPPNYNPWYVSGTSVGPFWEDAGGDGDKDARFGALSNEQTGTLGRDNDTALVPTWEKVYGTKCSFTGGSAVHLIPVCDMTFARAYNATGVEQLTIGTVTGVTIGTPEPATLTLLASGLLAMGLYGWRRRK